jgi:hypothetical protein
MIAPSRQTILAVAVWATVHAAVRFVPIVVFKSAVNRTAADAQNLRSADLVAAGVCDRAANQFVDDIFHGRTQVSDEGNVRPGCRLNL